MRLDQVLKFDDCRGHNVFAEIESESNVINISTCDYGKWHMVDVAPCDVQRLYDYLGEWLAARQTTGLGDK